MIPDAPQARPLATVGIEAATGVPAGITELAIIRMDGGVVTGPPLTWWLQPAGLPVGAWLGACAILTVDPRWQEGEPRVRFVG